MFTFIVIVMLRERKAYFRSSNVVLGPKILFLIMAREMQKSRKESELKIKYYNIIVKEPQNSGNSLGS